MQTLDFEKMMEKAKQLDGKKFEKKKVDEKVFEILLDKSGNTQNVGRFLAHGEDDTYFVKVYTHYFKEPNGRFFSGLCASTIGEKCAVCEYNKTHWNEYNEDQRNSRKRQMKFVSNYLVIKDPDHPEREGKVFLLKYGTKIKAKIDSIVDPKETDLDDDLNPKKRYNIFDFNTGKNFKMKVCTVKKMNNYDASEFVSEATPLFDGNKKKQEELSNQLYVLRDTALPKKEQLKTFEETQQRLLSVINGTSVNQIQETEVEDEDIFPTEETPKAKVETKPLELKTKPVEKTAPPKAVEPTDEKDFFNFDT